MFPNRPVRRLAGLLALLSVTTAPVLAAPADPADVASVDAIVTAYYEVVSGPAGSVPDIERDRSLHHPDAWVAIVRTGPDGERRLMRGGLDDYYGIEAGGTPPPREVGFFERETDRETRRSGDMVHVWSAYESGPTPDGPATASGVNSITLYWDGTRWWIMGWMFDATVGSGA
jgi:hypothetical protein